MVWKFFKDLFSFEDEKNEIEQSKETLENSLDSKHIESSKNAITMHEDDKNNMEKQKIDLVVAAFIIERNKVLLVHHKKLGKWLPPGGHIEKNEIPEDAVKREIKEETGIDIEFLLQQKYKTGVMKNAMPLHVNLHSVGDHLHYCFYYLCRPVNEAILNPNSEINECKWFSRDEINDPVLLPDIREIAKLAFQVYDQVVNFLDEKDFEKELKRELKEDEDDKKKDIQK